MLKIGLQSDMYELILLKLGVVVHITELYILIPV